jgi:hypothetical protein
MLWRKRGQVNESRGVGGISKGLLAKHRIALSSLGYDLSMPGFGRNTSKPLLVVIVFLFILVFVLARLRLLR